MKRNIIQVNERPRLGLAVPLSIQHMFAMFGASVVVPSLFGINPAIVLLMNGLGTLFFIFVTKGKAPAYLGSSFAFIGPALIIMSKHGGTGQEAFAYAQAGFVAVGLLGCLLALIIWKFGSRWIDIVLPPAAMGPVVALIGLELAGTAAGNAGMLGGEGAAIEPKAVLVFVVTLGVAVFGSVLFRKFLSVIPILIAIVAGYITAALCGMVNMETVQQASFFALPHFQLPKFTSDAVFVMAPVLLVIASEHIGHQIVTGKIIGRDLIRDPGLHRSLFADNFSTAISGLVGSVPTTTYGENIGVMAMTRVYSVWVIGGAAVLSVLTAFCGKFAALIQGIPGPVMGGISILLYGMIGASGLRILVDSKVDFGRNRNIVMTAVVFVIGLSGITLKLGQVELKGMVLATVVGMVMGILFYIFDKLHITNDLDDDPAAEETAAEDPQD